MVAPSKCPFCGETYSDAEEHIDRCPKTFHGACKRYDEARREFSDVFIDEVSKLIGKIITNTIDEEGLLRRLFKVKKDV